MFEAVRTRPVLLALVVAVVATLFAPGVTAQDLDSVVERRQELEEELDTVVRQLETVEATVAGTQDEIDELEDRRAELLTEADRVRDALQTRLREQFKHGGSTVLAALLSGDGVTDSIERAELLNALSHRDHAVIERADALDEQVGQATRLIEAKHDELAQLQGEMEELSQQLQVDLDEVQRLEQDLRTRKERQLIMRRGLQNGTYACIMAQPYHFIDSWGFPRSGGRRHKGTDVMGRMGAEVYAITNGRISTMKSGGLGGIVLYLWGDDGVRYYYAHLSGYADSAYVGKRVEAGELIAYNGNTGNARGSSPHVHFEVHPGAGAAVNPYPWLRPLC